MRKPIKAWWKGEFIPHKNDPNSGLVFIGGRTRRHWTSSAAHWVVNFYRKEWRWVLPFAVAFVGLCVAIARLPG